MTKDFTSAVIGLLVSDGTLDLDTPCHRSCLPAVASEPARREVTVVHLECSCRR